MSDFLTALDATAGIWAFILVCGGVAGLLLYAEHRADQARKTDRPAERPICGASNGELMCTLAPHDSRVHIDERFGSQYHSATFQTRGAA